MGAGQGQDDRRAGAALAVGRSADDPRGRPGSCLHHGGDRRPGGATVPRSQNLVQFQVDGPGEIVAVGNGDATSHEPFQARQRKAYNGLCQVIVKGDPAARYDHAEGRSSGLKEAAITFPSK